MGRSSQLSRASFQCGGLHVPESLQSPTAHCNRSTSPYSPSVCNTSMPQYHPMDSTADASTAGNAQVQVQLPCDVQTNGLESVLPHEDTVDGQEHVESPVQRREQALPILDCPTSGQHTVPLVNAHTHGPASSHAVYSEICYENQDTSIVANAISLPEEDLAAFQVHKIMSTCVHRQRPFCLSFTHIPTEKAF